MDSIPRTLASSIKRLKSDTIDSIDDGLCPFFKNSINSPIPSYQLKYPYVEEYYLIPVVSLYQGKN